MMYRYYDGDGAWMTVVMPFMWLVLLGLAVWLTFRLTRGSSSTSSGTPPTTAPRETPEQILDRRFAAGEIDAETHAAARRHLKDHAG